MKVAHSEAEKMRRSPILGRGAEQNFGRFEGLWNSHAPFKAQVTTWRLMWDRLPTKDNLVRRGVGAQVELDCCCCKREIETVTHSIINCPKIAQT